MLRFSVLMSVYRKDVPTHLKQALDSIVDQTSLPNEIVCVKDGLLSQDLNNLLTEFQKINNHKINIKIIDLPVNKGLANALNVGLQYCNFDWIARMDSDDISENKRFELMREFIAQNPNLDVVGSQIIEFSDNNNKLFKRHVCLSHDDIVKDLKYRCPMNHVTVFIKKKSLIKSGLYKKVLLEDYDLWIRMYLCGFRFGNIDKYLVRVRADIDLMSRRSGLNYFKGEYRIQKLMKSKNIIGLSRFTINIIKRGFVRFLPNKLLKKLYLLTRK